MILQGEETECFKRIIKGHFAFIIFSFFKGTDNSEIFGN